MAASYSSTALFSLPRLNRPRNGILSVGLNSVSQPQASRGFGVSLLTEKRLKPQKSPSPLCVSCICDTKAAVVTGKSWDKLILNSDTPVLVEFYASWCGPCRMVHRLIDEIATDYSGRLNCFVIDTDKDAQIAEKYDIKAVPVVLLLKNGEKRDFIIGTMPKEFYVAAIEKVLGS